MIFLFKRTTFNTHLNKNSILINATSKTAKYGFSFRDVKNDGDDEV